MIVARDNPAPPRPPLPDPIPQGPDPRTGTIALAIAACCFVAAPFTAGFEGFAPRPYLDPAKIKTFCNGETDLSKLIAGHVYSRDECGALLRQRLARDYAPKVIACVPGFADPRRVNAYAAAVDASYNAGPKAVCASSMARAFNAGQWLNGCLAFVGWYVTARYHGPKRSADVMQRHGWRWNGKAWVKTLRGLQRRRIAERDLCLRPVQ
jgi:lysozyme